MFLFTNSRGFGADPSYIFFNEETQLQNGTRFKQKNCMKTQNVAFFISIKG